MQQGENFKKYTGAFEKMLERIIVDDISTELYCRKYLTHLLKHKKYYLAIYADVLDKLIRHSTISKEAISVIDIGAGNGLLGIFAKFCGFKKVFLNDLDATFINASQNLAAQLNVEIDGFITGDIHAVRSYFKNEIPTAVIGTDVIEHIYNLDDLFKNFWQLNPAMVSVFTTASNPANYFKVRMLKKVQLKDELEGGTPDDHILFGVNPMGPFIKIREQIIRKHINGLPDSEVLALAKATRGMIKQDIIMAVDQYNISGKLPAPAQGTNTCDPLSGSWTERILSLDAYNSLYAAAGFTCKFYAGFYNNYDGPAIIRFVKKMLNAGITTIGKKISPYIVIVGSKNN